MSDKRCRHCHYLDPSHADVCPTQPLEVQVQGLKAQVKGWQDEVKRKEQWLAGANGRAQYWQHRYHTLRLENNALRRRLYQQNRKERMSGG